MVKPGTGQHSVKPIIPAAEQAQIKKAMQARRTRKPTHERYAPKRPTHTPDKVKLRPKSRKLITPDNEANLLNGFCKFANMPCDDAHWILVASILSGNDGYNFIQEELGITIPDPDNLFEKLVRELTHQYRVLNNANNFFKETYTFPEQKDHPVVIAHRLLYLGNDIESIYTRCAQVLVTSACRCFIASKDAADIGKVWYLLMPKENLSANKAAHYGFGGLRLLFNAANYTDNESRCICDWLVKAELVHKTFLLFKAMLAEEKPEIAENLERDPSFYHNSDSNAFAIAGAVDSENLGVEGVVHSDAKPAASPEHESITIRNICANATTFNDLCFACISMVGAGFDPQKLIDHQNDVIDYIAKSSVIDQLSGAPAISEHRADVLAFYAAGDNLANAGIDPMTVFRSSNTLLDFFNAVKDVSELGFDIPTVLQKVPAILSAFSTVDNEL